MICIGIHGKAGSGKDTLADYLVAKHGFTKVSFADGVRKGLAAATGDAKFLDNSQEAKQEVCEALGETRRKALQTYGLLMRDKFGADVWIRCAMRCMERSGNTKFVISDVRFQNEAEAIIKSGGMIIRLERPNNGYALQGEEAEHASEVPLPAAMTHMTWQNDGTIEDLYHKADSLQELLK